MKTLEDKVQHLLDLEEIKMLKYTYCRNNDGGYPEQPGSHMGPSADLFVEDGVWDGRPAAYAEGRENIRKFFEALRALPFAHHICTNPMITIEGDRATGFWHLIGTGIDLDGASTLQIAGYDEEYVRTPEGWRYKTMRVVWKRLMDIPAGWQEATPIVVE